MNKISSLFKWLYQIIRKVDKYNTTLESCKGREVNCVITRQVIPYINNSFGKNDDLTLLVQCRLEEVKKNSWCVLSSKCNNCLSLVCSHASHPSENFRQNSSTTFSSYPGYPDRQTDEDITSVTSSNAYRVIGGLYRGTDGGSDFEHGSTGSWLHVGLPLSFS